MHFFLNLSSFYLEIFFIQNKQLLRSSCQDFSSNGLKLVNLLTQEKQSMQSEALEYSQISRHWGVGQYHGEEGALKSEPNVHSSSWVMVTLKKHSEN